MKKKGGCLKKTLIGLGIIILVIILAVSCGGKEEKEKLVWPTSGLATLLPEPDAEYGYIMETDGYVSIKVDEFSADQYATYIKECKEKGFTEEIKEESDSFEAYSKNGERLEISYYSSLESMSIRLYESVQNSTFKWPSSAIVKLLPVPDSTTGKIEVEREGHFHVYVAKITPEKFADYADACMEKGFTVGYSRNEKKFDAKNPEGYKVYLKYIGFNTMEIEIYEPDDEDEEEDIDEEDLEDEDDEDIETEESSSAASSSSSTGVRDEFRALMNEYEVFFDEYIAFMQTYNSSSDTTSLMNQYVNYMSQFTETMSAMNNVDQSTLSNEEVKLYAETTTRISGKLLNAGL